MSNTECIVYTISEVAGLLGVNRQTVYNLFKRGLIKTINITRGKKGGTRVLKSDFEEYLQSCKEVK